MQLIDIHTVQLQIAQAQLAAFHQVVRRKLFADSGHAGDRVTDRHQRTSAVASRLDFHSRTVDGQARRVYTMDSALKDPAMFNWTNRWGTPFWGGPGYQMPPDVIAWSWSVISPLEDQQLGGLLMWVPGGFAYLVAGLSIVAAWLAPGTRHGFR